MTIPFLDLFKKVAGRLGKPSAPARDIIVQRAPIAEKKAGERLSKTVMPNTTRMLTPADPFQVAAGAAKGRTREMPASLTALNEPEPGERSIALILADVLGALPPGTVKSRDSIDQNRPITIKAAEVEKGMASGQPTALLTSIYEQVPDIFQQSVTPGDLTTVSLPLEKVLEQIKTLQVRGDQLQDEAVPQVETPFLQVTIEDTKKFGTSLSPIQTSAVPPVKVEPATARSIAKAEPEPVAQQKQTPNISGRRPISITPPTTAPGVPAAPSSKAPAPAAPSGPTRIPFKLPPNGAGGSASERVPASSGPPVPTPPPAPPATPSSPSRIPFKMTPPGPDLKPKLTLVPGVESAKSEEPLPAKPAVSVAATPPAATEPGNKSEPIRLRLGVCLRNLPAFQLSGPVPEIPEDVLLELPYSLVEPQLSSGRVSIEAKVFQQAIPEAFRSLFVIDGTETPVLLPLQEVLQHLPTSALKMRHDQEHDEVVNYFETPFSKHAEEDKKRFGKAGTPEARQSETGLPEPAEAPKEAAAEKPADAHEPAASQAPSLKPAESTLGSPVQTAMAEALGVASTASDVEAEAKKADANQPTSQSTEAASATPVTEAEKTPEGQSQDRPEATTAGTTVPAATPEVLKKDDVVAAEAKSNAKEFVLRASCLPGVSACSISFIDGLTMAGNFPPNLGAEGLCAVAPSLLQKVEKHMAETNLGGLTAMTLYCKKSPLTFFMKGNVCMSVLHSDEQLEPVTREQLADMTNELAHIFTQPETNDVHH